SRWQGVHRRLGEDQLAPPEGVVRASRTSVHGGVAEEVAGDLRRRRGQTRRFHEGGGAGDDGRGGTGAVEADVHGERGETTGGADVGLDALVVGGPLGAVGGDDTAPGWVDRADADDSSGPRVRDRAGR